MQRRGVQRCCKRRNSIAHVPYAQIVVFPTTDKARNRPFVRQLTEPCDTCYTPWMRILVPCDERSSRPEINVSVCHAGYNEGRGAAESDAQCALQNAVASKNSFAARTSQHVTAFHHFVTDSPKFGCTLISTERVELCREHVSWLQTNCEIPRKSTRETGTCMATLNKSAGDANIRTGCLVALSAESLLTDACMFSLYTWAALVLRKKEKTKAVRLSSPPTATR